MCKCTYRDDMDYRGAWTIEGVSEDGLNVMKKVGSTSHLNF